jgi:hypothetical protein
MKHFARLLSLLILVSAGLFFSNCGGGGGDDPDPAKDQLDKLVGTWTVTSATLNGTAKAEFVGAQLTITSGKQFNFTKDVGNIDASPWPGSVGWDFGADVNTTITRHDAGGSVAVVYSVSESSLTMRLDDYAGDVYDIGRVKSVEGDWVFNFTK